ncbi:MAG: hypothetical protein DMG62_10020 [Acidobacteria bacterium]|nr:MAG: hypothetical protein DMG63_02865 [Acidobacteriota bacterium]PYY23162.1 MAG: hypothetical protein DMG62_10020 [Acidobacteriota bacterium]
MNRKNWFLVFIFLFALIPTCANAQLWSGFLDPSRAADWSSAGVVNGIPNYTTICTTAACNTLASGTVTAASIQSALASCPTNGIVQIPAGTFSVAAFNATKSNCVLRGAGADRTKLTASSGNSGGGLGGTNNAFIHLMSGATGVARFGGVTTANWTGSNGVDGSYPLGATTITLSSTTGLVAGPVGTGSIVFLDQADDATDGWPAAGDLFSCATTANGCSNQGGNNYARSGRAQVEAVTVTGINGNQVTITPGIAYPNYRTSQTPGAYWNTGSPLGNAGIEDMTIDFSSTGVQGVYVINAANWWIKGCRLLSTATGTQETYHIFVIQSVHGTVRSNYIYGRPTTVNPFPLANYAYTDNESSDIVVENNIFEHNTSPLVPNDPGGRNVFGYNFFVNNNVGIAGIQLHSGNIMMDLVEGNNLWSLMADVTHGTHFFWTAYRNHFDGSNHNGPASTVHSGLLILTNNRFFNALGNVCGASDYSQYEANMVGSAGSSEAAACFNLGWAGNSSGTAVANDSNVKRAFMRWGNWDQFASANKIGTNDLTGTRFIALEVPSSITNFPNPLPATQTLPASLYLTGKPSWFGSVPFPAIGPDVANGNAPNTTSFPTGGHANKIPARVCWESLASDPAYSGSSPAIRTFNANACYSSTVSSVNPPTNVVATVR